MVKPHQQCYCWPLYDETHQQYHCWPLHGETASAILLLTSARRNPCSSSVINLCLMIPCQWQHYWSLFSDATPSFSTTELCMVKPPQQQRYWFLCGKTIFEVLFLIFVMKNYFSSSIADICSCRVTLPSPDSKVHGAHLGPTGPRRAPCWPHEPCYQGQWRHCKHLYGKGALANLCMVKAPHQQSHYWYW